ncbi:MAG: DUF5034 domain-containing protein [Cytophagaceae bacterium]|jgi:hypothetical protein|nr:DUF5034 domain-containing protein [Cytophagaceae bacterium]
MTAKLFKAACILLISFITALIAESCDLGAKCDALTYYDCNFKSLYLWQAENLGSDQAPAQVEPRRVLRENYGIYMSFEMNIEVREVQPVEQTAKRQRTESLFIQSAYAVAPECDFYTQKDTIEYIQIFSDRDFDTSHPAGSDITDCFYATEHYTSENNVSVNDYLNELVKYYSRVDITWPVGVSLYCMPKTPPDAGEYTFTVVAQLSDGRRLEQSIKAVLV